MIENKYANFWAKFYLKNSPNRRIYLCLFTSIFYSFPSLGTSAWTLAARAATRRSVLTTAPAPVTRSRRATTSTWRWKMTSAKTTSPRSSGTISASRSSSSSSGGPSTRGFLFAFSLLNLLLQN